MILVALALLLLSQSGAAASSCDQVPFCKNRGQTSQNIASYFSCKAPIPFLPEDFHEWSHSFAAAAQMKRKQLNMNIRSVPDMA